MIGHFLFLVNYSSYPIFHETLEITVKKSDTSETECSHSDINIQKVQMDRFSFYTPD